MSTVQSVLIVGGNLEKRKEKTKTVIQSANHQTAKVDFYILDGENSIGIEKIRELEKWASRKPTLSSHKAAIIAEAEKLTLQAQNALLKTLEEPPKKTLIILTAPQESLLLPTIVSRCKMIRLKPELKIKLSKETIDNQQLTINNLLGSGVGERLKKAEEIAKTREETITFLDQFTFFLRQILLEKYLPSISPTHTAVRVGDKNELETLSGEIIANILRRAVKTKEMVGQNINAKLALENFFLDLPLSR